MPLRAALYARYSTDRQSATSIEDQLRMCRERAIREGLQIVAEYRDEAVTGYRYTTARRGSAEMLADAAGGRFDVLVVEGLDRLARDQVDKEVTCRLLEDRYGIRILTLKSYDSALPGSKLIRSVDGIIDSTYIENVRIQNHRALAGKALNGYVASGRSFGYDLAKEPGGTRYQINPSEAEHVRWIFERYAAGWSAKQIVSDLNGRGVQSARGGTWSVSAIVSSPEKGLGVLNNQLYIGTVTWNKTRWVKDSLDPFSKRRPVMRPPQEWIVVERPELRIVPQELWDAVRARMGRNGKKPGKGRGRRVSTLFGGILECDKCGGAFVATDAYRYGCATHKDRGASVCPNSGKLGRREADSMLVQSIRALLLDPNTLAHYERHLRGELEASGSDERAARAKTRIGELERKIRNLTDALAELGPEPSLREAWRAAKTEHAQLQAELTKVPTPIDVEALLEEAKQQLEAAAELFADGMIEELDASRGLARELFGRLVVRFQGDHAIIRGMKGADDPETKTPEFITRASSQINRVAGAGFEPATFGL